MKLIRLTCGQIVDRIRADGFYKTERVIESPQSPEIRVNGTNGVLNLCANNYLGLADDPRVVKAAQEALGQWGFGMASVRFICGTQTVHKQLEAALSKFLRVDDSILYSSCFDANGGLFETLLSEEDAVISDELNHASIVDGIRLCKAKRFRYRNNDMRDLEARLQEADAAGARFKLIATDGVFSMDGIIADLRSICDARGPLWRAGDGRRLARGGIRRRRWPRHARILRCRSSSGHHHRHAGQGAGRCGGRLYCGTQGNRRAAAPALAPLSFSNAVPPSIAAATLKTLELLGSEEGRMMRERVHRNGEHFREALTKLGFDLVPGHHPIIPVMLGDAELATRAADALLKEGVYVIGFSYPVVPKGKARLRTQMSAAHTPAQIDRAITAFAKVGKALGAIR